MKQAVNQNKVLGIVRDPKFLLAAIVLIAFCVRLYRINYPLLDWHSWRQADTASVTREYIKNGVDILRPQYHDLSNIPNNLDNSQNGYRMVEFPFVNVVIANVIRTFPNLPLVPTSRLFSVFISLGTLLSLYTLVYSIFGKKEALLTAFLFAVLPYSVYYSRVILPEPYMLFFSTFSITTFYFWLKTSKLKFFFLSATGLICALLLKPFVAFLAPVYITLIVLYKKSFLKPFFFLQIMLYGIICFTPLLAWRNWILQFPEGIPASSWLFNSNGIRFRPAWVRWLGYERLTKMFLGFAGTFFLPFSVFRNHSSSYLIVSWWVSIFLYFAVLATGNVHHDYYQNLMLPIVVISLAVGTSKGFEQLKKLAQKVSKRHSGSIALGTILVFYLFMFNNAWHQIKGNFNVNHWEYDRAGKRVDTLLPKDAKVIAPAFGDTMFLFQTNRRGWPIGSEIEDKITKGATHYVTTSYDDEARDLEKKYETIEKTDQYLIIDLRKPL